MQNNSNKKNNKLLKNIPVFIGVIFAAIWLVAGFISIKKMSDEKKLAKEVEEQKITEWERQNKLNIKYTQDLKWIPTTVFDPEITGDPDASYYLLNHKNMYLLHFEKDYIMRSISFRNFSQKGDTYQISFSFTSYPLSYAVELQKQNGSTLIFHNIDGMCEMNDEKWRFMQNYPISRNEAEKLSVMLISANQIKCEMNGDNVVFDVSAWKMRVTNFSPQKGF